MVFTRRRVLGGLAAGSAMAVSPRAFAEVKASARLPMLAEARAALQTQGSRVMRRDVMAIADFSQHSGVPRFHLVDVMGGRVLASWLVSHGRGSDPANTGMVQQFSNRPGSNASSRGSYVTSDIYSGKHGRSRRLIGLDPENNLALQRGIVIHSADYVNRGMATTQGRVGRSEGCFAVSRDVIGEVLTRLGPGTLLYAGK
ncbi:MAG: murein L,D-transpeptidase catalytic domain family protein [Sphingomonadales bacterium]|nr:murein L,D-transpeptidase catalytic domain family protein [Sphingomonadales bacterium]MDE2567318.1 murein L,D-transpeptidase catalytic domain family protein [Sphingomonadales bacterium]